jgi:hypothetical protein
MNCAAELAERYSYRVPVEDPAELNDDAFAYNETASVSILTAAAYGAGFIALAEFSSDKAIGGKMPVKSEGNNSGNGRIDLWMMDQEKSWAFEFKQFCPLGASGDRLERYLNDAIGCAHALLEDAADCAVAGLIWPLWWVAQTKKHDEEKVRSAAEKVRNFARRRCDYAWAIPGFNGSPPTFVMFNIVKDWC